MSIDGAILVLRIEKWLHQNKIDIWVCDFAMWKGEGKSNWMWWRRGRKSTIVGTCEGGVRIGNGACISLRNALTSLSLNTPSPPWSCSSSNTHYHPNTSHLPTIHWNPRGGKVLEIGEVDDRRKWSSGKINRSVSHHFRWVNPSEVDWSVDHNGAKYSVTSSISPSSRSFTIPSPNHHLQKCRWRVFHLTDSQSVTISFYAYHIRTHPTFSYSNPPMSDWHHDDIIITSLWPHFTPLRRHHQNTINTARYRSFNLTCSYLVTW